MLLVRASAHAIADDRRNHIVTRTHLDEALDTLTAALSPVPETPGDWAWRLTELEAQAHTVVDIARTLTAARSDRTDTEVLAWAEAVQASIASHARDLDMAGHPLSNTVGAVLDPIVSLRRCLRLAPGATARATFSTLVASSRDEALALADEYRDPATFERAAALAWTQAQVQLRHLGMDHDEASLFQELASRILYSDSTLRPSSAVLTRNTRGPSALWGHGISGDVPIVLVRIDASEDEEIIRQLLRAHEYWRMKQLTVDLVILNEQTSSYAQQDLQASLEAQVRTSQARTRHEGHAPHGSVFMLRADLVSDEDRTLLQTAARAVLLSRTGGTLAEQIGRRQRSPAALPLPPPRPATQPLDVVPPPRAQPRVLQRPRWLCCGWA